CGGTAPRRCCPTARPGCGATCTRSTSTTSSTRSSTPPSWASPSRTRPCSGSCSTASAPLPRPPCSSTTSHPTSTPPAASGSPRTSTPAARAPSSSSAPTGCTCDAPGYRGGPMTVYLVRHASAGSRNELDPADRERPLDATGRVQARKLTDWLRHAAIDRILTSPYPRCVQTVEPLAEATGIQPELCDWLGEQAPIEQSWKVLEEAAASTTVV